MIFATLLCLQVRALHHLPLSLSRGPQCVGSICSSCCAVRSPSFVVSHDSFQTPSWNLQANAAFSDFAHLHACLCIRLEKHCQHVSHACVNMRDISRCCHALAHQQRTCMLCVQAVRT